MRSIPEKTLEHWASIYATYRYRSWAGLWWPSFDEDISVGDLATRWPGKVFNLELKTTESYGGAHRAKVRVSQLLKYLSSPVPTYYVFPTPRWDGPIHEAAAAVWLGGTDKTELGFTRSAGQWFGEWTRVVPDYALYGALASTYSIGTSVPYRVQENLFTFDAAADTMTLTGRYAGTTLPWLGWREFWDSMDSCGGPSSLPSMFAVPQGNHGQRARRSDLVEDVLASGRSARSSRADREIADMPQEPQTSVRDVDFYAPADRTASPEVRQEYVRVDESLPAVARQERADEDVEDAPRVSTVYISAERVADFRDRGA
ncbi:hypothetical protein [Cellulosimicrobium cellulans]|uniref:hypothetical protein n=1 Tax=Cellulosimicrobium cellulans TaxID=1710 RepID=UPI00130E2405|nr:hypothetical protein [Cellulosimicrobium cellulans]